MDNDPVRAHETWQTANTCTLLLVNRTLREQQKYPARTQLFVRMQFDSREIVQVAY